jgi:hypothetical protein
LIHLGVDTGCREYSTFARQIRALSACRMSLGFGTETMDAKPIERLNAWTDGSGARETQEQGVIELAPKFFTSLTEFAVPLDARALAALKHSSLALDIFTWLAHRLLRVKRSTEDRVTACSRICG